jgi:hypothetical protein
MYNVDDLKNKRSQAAAKLKKIVATVDHNSGNNKRWADVKASARWRITTKRLKTRGLDMMKTKTLMKMRKARKAKRMTMAHP